MAWYIEAGLSNLARVGLYNWWPQGQSEWGEGAKVLERGEKKPGGGDFMRKWGGSIVLGGI